MSSTYINSRRARLRRKHRSKGFQRQTVSAVMKHHPHEIDDLEEEFDTRCVSPLPSSSLPLRLRDYCESGASEAGVDCSGRRYSWGRHYSAPYPDRTYSNYSGITDRSRSRREVSPFDQRLLETIAHHGEDIEGIIDDRPPFVVRHVGERLIARPPGLRPEGPMIHAWPNLQKEFPSDDPSSPVREASKRRHRRHKRRSSFEDPRVWDDEYRGEENAGNREGLTADDYCPVCHSYARYMGKRYRGHASSDHRMLPSTTTSTVPDEDTLRRLRVIREYDRPGSRSRESRRNELIYGSDLDREGPPAESPIPTRQSRWGAYEGRVSSRLGREEDRALSDRIADRVENTLWRERSYRDRIQNLFSRLSVNDKEELDRLETDLRRPFSRRSNRSSVSTPVPSTHFGHGGAGTGGKRGQVERSSTVSRSRSPSATSSELIDGL